MKQRIPTTTQLIRASVSDKQIAAMAAGAMPDITLE
jgi:hypothetical protein